MSSDADPRAASVAVIGSGPAGLITAYTLLRDGFSQVQILTRDSTPGGVWAAERVYPGLKINNVYGEYRFSAMEMPRPVDTGGRLTGQDLRAYMEAFSDKFLKKIIRFETEVVNIRRDEATSVWFITVANKRNASLEILKFSRVVLCTGGCSVPKVPSPLAPAAAKRAGFRGLVIHSKHFASELDTILNAVPRQSPDADATKSIVIIGGGKSAQDMAAYLAHEGRKVAVVFETADAFLASPIPLPEFIRKSRFLSIMSGHVVLRSRLERFLHNTWLGSKMTHLFWSALSEFSLRSLSIARDSPLHNVHSLFWTVKVNDEGVSRQDGFHALVNSGKIKAVAPARVEAFGLDGETVLLTDGRTVKADLILLATGYLSSWADIFDDETAELVGITRNAPGQFAFKSQEDERISYYSLENPPPSHPESEQWAASMYNGIVPAKNIARRDFVVNGAVFTTNVGYTSEVVAHWVSAYFLGDTMNIPKTPEEAYQHAERSAAWIRRRYPDALVSVNESYSSNIAFWTWPQYTDQLLEEMGLRSMRSGGNWFNWPFKVIDLEEIITLAEERNEKRALEYL
ncbi:FAD/NAD-P-binding domain-containing protein [Mycena maculata]|uniref:FAD/NAD-P-binding domain-containing protein n=1 Tax=Mycena maculata TaxID=230809 RepID=A0AAD7NF04_9AGAR|nr:FAD/NAD-P-binding domain-containing protein [Mycena maculata]